MCGMECATWATAFVSFLTVVALIYVQVFLPWWRRAKFEVIFEKNKEPWCRRFPKNSWIRLEIKNVGRSVAKQCIGKLMEVRNSEQERERKFDPTALHWVSRPMTLIAKPNEPGEFDKVSNESVDIHSGDSEFLDVVRAFEHKKPLMKVFPADKRARSIKWEYEPGEYYFKITILGANIRNPVSREFCVTWTGNHNDLTMGLVN